MRQTILCDLIANWEKYGQQPDLKVFDFDDMLSIFQEAQSIMFDLEKKSEGKEQIKIGPELFSFPSFVKWEQKAQGWFQGWGLPLADLICLDAIGRICRNGSHFMRARDEETFPVTVYHIDPDFELEEKRVY